MGMAEVISNAAEPPKQNGKEEQIDDNDSPEPPVAMLEASLNDATDPDINNKISETISNNLESINDDETSPPTPFNSAEFEKDDAIAKKEAKDEMNPPAANTITNANNDEGEEGLLPPSDIDSIYEPPREVIEGDELRGMPTTNRRGREDIESRARRDIQEQDNIDTAGSSVNDDSVADMEATVEAPTSVDQEAGDTEIHIPEAFLVEDIEEEVYIATPTLPWWKQKRTRILISVVSILLGTMAIALGVSLSQSNNPESTSSNSTVTLFVTPPPTISIAPSSSTAPSTPPPTIIHECFNADDGGKDGILYNAVRAYVYQDCANNKKCDIGKLYGWPMNSWCVGSVTDMSYLFEGVDTFNEDINGWNTSSVTTMWSMFVDATSFNGDVSNFNTSSVTRMNVMFAGATSFNRDLSNFDTSSVTDMYSMFSYATSFNGDVSDFDTSSVNDMGFMFNRATSFNGDVSSFDTSSVIYMDSMFNGATSFNKDLCSWQDSFPYTNATNIINIFTNSGCTYQDTPNETQQGPFCSSDCGAPSMSPSSSLAPTASPKPTQSPTISSSPTDTCYWVDIIVVFDDYPEETSWQLQKRNNSGDYNLLKTFNGTWDDQNEARTESMCLEDGEQTYQFTIYDTFGDGIEAPGYYNMTSNGNGRLIVKGGDFEYSESTIFSVPYES